ncbi:MAG: hemolysin family protein [Parachlamydia sp.]|nr:hemolysin family protein [Parachlamydia sp.]
MDLIFYILILALLTFCSGYFSASETALFSLSSMRIKAYRDDPNPLRRLIAQLVLQPRDLLVTVFMLNTLVNILIQNVSSNMAGPDGNLQYKILLPFFLTLLFGEVVPKYIGLQNNVALSDLVAPSIDFLQRMMQPVRRLVIAVTTPISRGMFFFLKKEESLSREELTHVLEASEALGVMTSDEAELVWGYLDLQEILVKELMRPRQDMLCYNIEEPLTKLQHLFVDRERSRIPVYEKDVDHMIGILSAKKYLLHQSQFSKPEDVRSFLSKPLFVPKNTPVRNLLRRFEEHSEEMAIAVDEYGAVTGLITREDIIEVVVGKVMEQHDQKSLYTRAGANEIIASGKLELAVFNELFDVELVSENNMATIGGWLIEQMGDIPKSGTKFTTDQFLFQVLAAEPRRVRRIYIRKLVKRRDK